MKNLGEAEVYIDGVKLTDQQVMSVRVGLCSWLMTIEPGSELAKNLGGLGDNYRHHTNEVVKLLVDGGNRPDRLAARRK